MIECSLLGPAAITSHLVDLGAEVIKVESPAGDYGRKMTWPILRGHVAAAPPRQPGQAVAGARPQGARGDRGVRGPRARRRRRRRGDAARVPRPRWASGTTRLQGAQPEDRDVHDLRVRRHRPVPNLPEPRHRLRRVVGHLQPVLDDEGFTPHPRPGQHRHHRRAPRSAPSASSPRSSARRRPARARAWRSRSPTAAAYFDWYRIETWKGYDDYPDDVVTGNPSDNYERRAARSRRHVGGRALPVLRVVRRPRPVHGVGAVVLAKSGTSIDVSCRRHATRNERRARRRMVAQDGRDDPTRAARVRDPPH